VVAADAPFPATLLCRSGCLAWLGTLAGRGCSQVTVCDVPPEVMCGAMSFGGRRGVGLCQRCWLLHVGAGWLLAA
jgi:hypothetical protein